MALRLPEETLRPAYAVGQSVCTSFGPPVDLYPIRSPLVVADFLLPHVRGKTFCEIGTRNGDVLGCLAHYASSVTAVEMAEHYCEKLRDRGLGVACQNFESFTAKSMPAADVYYWWPADAGGQNELWLQMLARAMRVQRRHAKVFIGFDAAWQPGMPSNRSTDALDCGVPFRQASRAATGSPTCSTCRG